MAKMRFNYRSQVLSRYVDITIVCPTNDYSFTKTSEQKLSGVPIPQKKFLYSPGMKFQTVYLLSDEGDDDSVVYRKTNVERYAEDNEVMLVTPCLAGVVCPGKAPGEEFFNFLTDELPVVIRSLFASSDDREDNFIAGYGTGCGYALAAALKRPDLYSEYVGMTCEGYEKKDVAFDVSAQVKSSGGKSEFSKLMCFALEGAGNAAGQPAQCRELANAGYDVSYEKLDGTGRGTAALDGMLKAVICDKMPLKRAPIYNDQI